MSRVEVTSASSKSASATSAPRKSAPPSSLPLSLARPTQAGERSPRERAGARHGRRPHSRLFFADEAHPHQEPVLKLDSFRRFRGVEPALHLAGVADIAGGQVALE